jgi:DNA-binding transcriptional ArsR family regulator
MNAEDPDVVAARIAAAIGEPARARILYSLVDGHARTSTELAVVAGVSPSTTSAHLNRLMAENLIKLFRQGKHRYYSLEGTAVARALEALQVIAGRSPARFVPNTPSRLLMARTCYDHIAGRVGVLLHNRFKEMGFLSASARGDKAYDLTSEGIQACNKLGIDLETARALRRKFAYACLDWSERQPHIGGALGAVLLTTMLRRKWLVQDLDSRALTITNAGHREMQSRFGFEV